MTKYAISSMLHHTDLLAGGTEVFAVDVVVVIVVGHALVARLALALEPLDLRELKKNYM